LLILELDATKGLLSWFFEEISEPCMDIFFIIPDLFLNKELQLS